MFKKSFVMLSVVATLLTGCATMGEQKNSSNPLGTVTEIGTAIFQTAVKQKCHTEITANQYYQLASIIMAETQKSKIIDKACSCVAEKAPQSVSMTEIATAIIDTNSRPKIVAKAVSNTLKSCAVEYLK